jgi:uncharacterized protein YndB with AHSA1/START domain
MEGHPLDFIAKHIQIQAEVSKVLDAVTTTGGLRAWWTDCDVGRAGEEATFRFGGRQVVFRVDRIDAKGIELTCVQQTGQPDWQDTHLSIRAIAEGGGTRVDLLHDGFRERNDFYARCVDGWDHYVRSLRAYCETGRGSPWSPGIGAPGRGAEDAGTGA